MFCRVTVADVERAPGNRSLQLGHERAILVRNLETSLERERLPAMNPIDPHDDARRARSAMLDATSNERRDTHGLISSRCLNHRIGRQRPIDLDHARNRTDRIELAHGIRRGLLTRLGSGSERLAVRASVAVAARTIAGGDTQCAREYAQHFLMPH